MKGLLVSISIVLFVVGGFYSFTKDIPLDKQALQAEGTSVNKHKIDTSYVTPISHATFVLMLDKQVIYNDPTGGAGAFMGQQSPDIILLSDIHTDHFDPDTLKSVSTGNTILVMPQAVRDILPDDIVGTIVVLENGGRTNQKGIDIEAIPMYNLPEFGESRHPKGRGNGYVLSAEGKRFYIAGDTSATPEMRALTDIDVAFVPMNLPFTMSVEEAADGVATFKPKVVHPYHYRGENGLSDINRFKEMVQAADPNIHVALLNFYPERTELSEQ